MGVDDARVAQYGQVTRRRGLRQVERRLDVAYAQLAVRQQRDDAQARLVAEGFE